MIDTGSVKSRQAYLNLRSILDGHRVKRKKDTSPFDGIRLQPDLWYSEQRIMGTLGHARIVLYFFRIFFSVRDALHSDQNRSSYSATNSISGDGMIEVIGKVSYRYNLQ